jgi:hypothetical protein
LPITPEQKEQIVAELSAARKLPEASTIRLAALRATLQPALRGILEKAAGTPLSARLPEAFGISSQACIGFEGRGLRLGRPFPPGGGKAWLLPESRKAR